MILDALARPGEALQKISFLSSHGELLFGADKKCAQGADHPAGEDHDDDHKNRGQRTGKVGMLGREPRQSDGENVFAEAERDIRNRLGRWGNGGTRGGLASVGDERDYGSEQRGEQLLLRGKLLRGFEGEQSGDGTRIKVCSAFQMRSKAGIVSPKNSIANKAVLAAITGQVSSGCSPGGSGRCPKRASRPSAATVAQRLSPAANPIAASSAKTSEAGICRKLGIRVPTHLCAAAHTSAHGQNCRLHRPSLRGVAPLDDRGESQYRS
jgi:hypothetical protein